MPELCRFYNIIIKMIFMDDEKHHKPHFHVFYAEYKANTGRLEYETLMLSNEVLHLLEDLNIDCKPNNAEWPKIVMKYRVSPNYQRTAFCDAIYQQQLRLADKLRNFILLNNIYGDAYKNKPKVISLKKDPDWDMLLKDCIARLEVILNKKFVIDILEVLLLYVITKHKTVKTNHKYKQCNNHSYNYSKDASSFSRYLP